MLSKTPKATAAVSLLLVFSLLQVSLQISLAGPGVRSKEIALAQAGAVTGKLLTSGNRAVIVNGNSATTGATILTGATIETPEGVSATINLGPLGRIDLAPNTKVEITYNDGQIKVKLISGCAVVKNKKGTQSQIDTEQGTATSNDGKNAGILDVCFPQGAPNPVVNQGAASNAGAGSSGGGSTAGGTGTGGGGISTKTAVLLGAAGVGALVAAVIIVPCRRGRNPSPGEPRGRNDECR